MKLLGTIILVLLGVLAIFAAVNWTTLTTPAPLSFVAFSVEAPLGVVLLGFALVFALVLLAYIAAQRSTMYAEARRHTQELRAQREIADQAEASRIEQLRLQVERESASLRTALEQTANGLAANIGEVDDKLDRILQAADNGAGRILPPSGP